MSEFKVNNITGRDGSSGPVVAGVSTVSTSAFMVMPSGNTEIRGAGSGRAVRVGGTAPGGSSTYDAMDYVTISTLGDAIDFGDLTETRTQASSCASSTRGLIQGGTSIPGITSTIDYVTISSQGGANDFGDLTQAVRAMSQGSSNNIIGVRYGGYGSSVGGAPDTSISNVIDFVTISTTGDATNFGSLTSNGFGKGYAIHGCQSPTRGIAYGGANNTAKKIEFITFATRGNGQEFGECTVNQNDGGALSDSTRGVQVGAGSPAADVMEYITMATFGNGTDFGDLTDARGCRGASNATRGVMMGGYDGSGQTNTIDYITIQTTGNAQDFGDLTQTTQQMGALSDAHGGLG